MNKPEQGNDNCVEGFLGDKLNFAEYIRIKILVAFTIMRSGLGQEQALNVPDHEQLMDEFLEIEPVVGLKVIINNKANMVNCCTGCFNKDVPEIDLLMVPFKYALN